MSVLDAKIPFNSRQPAILYRHDLNEGITHTLIYYFGSAATRERLAKLQLFFVGNYILYELDDFLKLLHALMDDKRPYIILRLVCH